MNIYEKKIARMRMTIYVIGAGIAGIEASLVASSKGFKVMLFDEILGGNFLNKTCIPTKLFIELSRIEKDLGKIKLKAIERINSIRSRYVSRLEKGEVEHVGEKVYLSNSKILFKDRKIYLKENDAAIIASGSIPIKPNIKGSEFLMYTPSILDLKEIFDKIVMIGAGPEGVEMAEIFSNLGSKVTLVEKKERILSLEDEDVSKFMLEVLKKKGINVILGEEVLKLEKNHLLEVHLSSGNKLISDAVFSCIGWEPNLEPLSNVEIKVDDFLRVDKNIFAAGDVIRAGLANVAKYQARIAALNAIGANIKFEKMNYPYVIFTQPSVSSFGYKENHVVGSKVVRIDLGEGIKGIIDGVSGFLKIILDKQNRIIGAVCVSNKAGEIINTLYFLSKKEIRVDELSSYIPSSPSYYEDIIEAVKMSTFI